MTWLSDLGLLTKIQKNGQSCQSETKEKEISSSCLAIYSFVSLTDCTTKTVEVIGEVSRSSILNLHLPIYTAASFHIQITSLPSVIPPHTIAAKAAARTQAGSHRKAEGRCLRDQRISLLPRSAPTGCVSPSSAGAVSAALLPKGRGLKDCVPPKSVCWSPDSLMWWYLGVGNLGGHQVTKVEPSWLGLEPLYEESWERGFLNSAVWRYSKKVAACKSTNRSSSDSDLLATLILDFQLPELWEINIFCLSQWNSCYSNQN